MGEMLEDRDRMTSLLLIAASALVVAIAVTPLMRRLALQTGTVDKPAARKIHASPVPLLGGAAIYLAFVLVLIFFGERGVYQPGGGHLCRAPR